MLLNKKHLKLFIVSTGIIASGCATIDYGTVLDNNTVTIERQHSRVADIGQVTVYQQKDGNLIRGEVQRNHFGEHKPILGHVDIELLNTTGKIIHKDRVDYKRTSVKSRTAIFTAKLEESIEEGSRLRIIHHVVR